MISTALFLTAGLMASPVIIQDVTASREAGHLRVEVASEGGIDPDGARTRIDGGSLLIYLPGTRVRVDNRSWELADGAGEIKAHRHKFETELVVPLAGNGCTGPVELQGSDTGITALVGCDGTVAARAETKIKAKAKASDETLKALVELPSEPAAIAAAAPVVAKADRAEKVEKVEAKPETKPAINAEPKSDTKTEAKPAPVEAKAAVSDPKPVAEAKKLTELLAVPPASTTATGTAGATAGGSLRSIGMPAALLAILAVGAYVLARRRRTVSVRHIQILETASLGPKRSLVVARVGDETLILGTSEAGITLLKNGGGEASGTSAALGGSVTTPSFRELETAIVKSVAADKKVAQSQAAAQAQVAAEAQAAAEAEAAAFEISQPLEEALADIPEPGDTVGNARTTVRGGFRAIEGGLAGLLNDRRLVAAADDESEDGDAFPFETRSPARRGTRSDERLSLKNRLMASDRPQLREQEERLQRGQRGLREDDSFEDLLEDSIEDQELRQKLAAGMSARVR